VERSNKGVKSFKAADQKLAEDENERKSLTDWSQKSQAEAGEFAGFLQTARALFRRYPELVTAETFPQTFRFAWEQAIAETDPDSEIGDYGDFQLIKEGLLSPQDSKVAAAAFANEARPSKRPDKATGGWSNHSITTSNDKKTKKARAKRRK
jgi:hypothetical protein